MAENMTPQEERRGTRYLFVGAAIAAVVLGIAVLAWPLFTPPPDPQDATDQRAQQSKGTSMVGKRTAPPPEAATGTEPEAAGRALAIIDSAEPRVELRPEQIEAVREFAAQRQPRSDVDFSIVVGSAVPESTKLQDIPVDLANVLPSYKGDKYFVVPNQFVIVERRTRRIIAIVPT